MNEINLISFVLFHCILCGAFSDDGECNMSKVFPIS